MSGGGWVAHQREKDSEGGPKKIFATARRP
jgi:hypothetical protein